MNKELFEKVNEILVTDDKEKFEQFMQSEDFQQTKKEVNEIWGKTVQFVQTYLGNIRLKYNELKPVINQLAELERANNHYIRYTSYNKKKSQRKKWKKRKK